MQFNVQDAPAAMIMVGMMALIIAVLGSALNLLSGAGWDGSNVEIFAFGIVMILVGKWLQGKL